MGVSVSVTDHVRVYMYLHSPSLHKLYTTKIVNMRELDIPVRQLYIPFWRVTIYTFEVTKPEIN